MLYPGAVVAPDDLNKLSWVCATIYDENGIVPSSRTGQAIAAHVFRLFMNGLTEEWELLRIMRHRQTHQSRTVDNGHTRHRVATGIKPAVAIPPTSTGEARPS